MNRTEELMRYIPIADFIAAMDSKHCEVVIHDVRDPEHSILYITSPSLTQRHRGNGMTDFARELIQTKAYLHHPFIANYVAESESLTFRSSTYFIMEGKELIGLMCVNTEIGHLLKGMEILREALLVDPARLSRTEVFNIGSSIEDRMEAIFQRTLGDKDPETLRIADRRYIVNELRRDGVFEVKGKVAEVAKRLAISEKTIYRYLKEMEE